MPGKIMPYYIVRVELINIPLNSDPVYQRLHEAMFNAEFLRQIEDEHGTFYYLPDAEYCIKAWLQDADKILERARAATETVYKDFRILVTESNDIKWHNLKEVISK